MIEPDDKNNLNIGSSSERGESVNNSNNNVPNKQIGSVLGDSYGSNTSSDEYQHNSNNSSSSNSNNNDDSINNKNIKRALYKLEEEDENSSGGEQSSILYSKKKNKNKYSHLDEEDGEESYEEITYNHNTKEDDESNIPLKEDVCTDKNHIHYSPHEEKTHNNYVLTTYDKIPPYLQGNEFIVSGYRVNFSYKLCIKNLLGTVLFFILMIYTLSSKLHQDATPTDRFVFSIFFICAQAQMLFSTLFHIFSSVSGKTYLWMARLDYTGISLMIVGSHFPPIYYVFSCQKGWGTFYLCLISIMGIVGVAVGMIPIFQTYAFRTFRTLFFIGFGLFIVVPLPQVWAQHGIEYFWPILYRLMLMGSLYIIGAAIYATRYPECCCKPGRLDNGFSSHPIWHLFVVAAAVVQYTNCLYAYNHYSEDLCIASLNPNI
ncbi:hypothetical protein DICPUDRAFT_153704 [Dictyostelium purpureum]|uniref:Adiponectin receptor protein n=1 Tax=Dictyostelium purpureum TaxID=5786 RepID=F0ZPJ9_DICPU|nr:uncharacterized protein DICPUDRAFT_153704 [Dictyostelium purpureum]EGC34146.1 hypothetical protein DICPUDRAFT_153704 [Dictyostelium purpureum]|eukprot:XP_003289344.1 hypothetical protein DICPUDRAFT_153704 [Dictyostelium purpureum]